MASAAQQKPLIAGGIGAAPNVEDIFRVAVLAQPVALDPAGADRVKKDSPPPKAFSPEPAGSPPSQSLPKGAVLSREETRAVIAARLLTVMNGRSGVRLQVAERLAAMLNGAAPLPVLPAPPLAGDGDDDQAATATSSDDDNVATLSALADALKGEGFELGTNASLSPDGDYSSSSSACPGLSAAERAALCAGGAAAAGVGALAVHGGRRLLAAAAAVAALSCEAFGAPIKAALDAEALEAQGVKAAQAAADQLRGLLDGSRLANSNRSAAPAAARLFSSLPQRLGAALDGLAAAYAAVRPAVQAGALPPVAVKAPAAAAAAAAAAQATAPPPPPAAPSFAPASEASPTLAPALLEAARALLAVGAGALARARALDPLAFTAAADGEDGPAPLLAAPAVAEAAAALAAAQRRVERVGRAMLADPLAAPGLAAATAATEALASANAAVAVEALAAVVALRRQEGGASVSAATAAMAALEGGSSGGAAAAEGGGGGKKQDKKSGGKKNAGAGGAGAGGLLALGKGTALMRAYVESCVAIAARGGPVVEEAPGADVGGGGAGHAATAETSTLPAPPVEGSPPVVRDVGAALLACRRALSPGSPLLARLLDDCRAVAEANAARRKPKIAKGARDFAPEQMAVRDAAFSAVTAVFRRHGAVSIDTPVFELRETLTGKYGEDSKLIYDLADQGGEALSLRYDLTVPFARYCAVTGTTALRRYHVGKVYRRDQPQMNRGRFREFFQCDFDVAGSYSAMVPDAEVLKVLTEILADLGLGDFVIKLNHRGLLDACLSVAGVPAAKTRAICSAVDKLDKEPWPEVRREMVEDKGLDEGAADAIGRLVVLKGEPRALLERLTGGGGGSGSGGDAAADAPALAALAAHPSAAAALADLGLLFSYLEAMGGPQLLSKISFDLSLARGLDYYTGVIYEAVLKSEDGAHVGSIAAGGRYDGLVGMFSGKDVPAVGVSIGIERVFAILEARTKERREAAKAKVLALAAAASGGGGAEGEPPADPAAAAAAAAELAALPRATQTEVLVASIGSGLMPRRMALAADLWRSGVAAEFGYKPNPKMGDQISAALEQGVPLMALFGEEEINAGTVKIKDMARKTEDVVAVADLAVEVLRRLGRA